MYNWPNLKWLGQQASHNDHGKVNNHYGHCRFIFCAEKLSFDTPTQPIKRFLQHIHIFASCKVQGLELKLLEEPQN